MSTTAERTRARTNKPQDFWNRKGDYTLGLDKFRITCLRGPGQPMLRLDSVIENIAWQDQSAVLTGTASFRLNRDPIDVSEGHRMRLEWSHANGRWVELWTMRILSPEKGVAGHTTGVQLADDLTYLTLSKDDFHYHANKSRKAGWLPHEIVAAICKRYGVKIGHLPKTKHRIKKMSLTNVSPLDAIVWALKKEREAEGTKMRIAWRNGALTVTPLTRSKELLVMGDTLIDAAYTRAVLREGFATVVKLTSSAYKGKKGKKRKLTVTVRSAAGIKRYGYVHQTMTSTQADSVAEGTRIAKRHLAKVARPEQTLSLTHPGIPTLRRLHALKVALPDIGVQQIVYVTGVNHRLDAQGYTMDVSVRFDDPFVDDSASVDAHKKCATAKDHGRDTRDCRSAEAKTAAKPKKAVSRSNK